MTTIVLADDHKIVRQGLKALLDAEPDFSVVGEVGDGLEVEDTVQRIQPDVLVLDLMMPGLNGLEVTRRIAAGSTQTKIVVLSMHSNEAYVLEALKNGAMAYVLKDSGSTDLLQAVRDVSDGRRYLSPPLSEHAIEAYTEKAKGVPVDAYHILTAREREVLQLAAEGDSNPDIAARLSIRPRTAETHRANVMRKLKLHGHTDLVRFALARGIIAPEV